MTDRWMDDGCTNGRMHGKVMTDGWMDGGVTISLLLF